MCKQRWMAPYLHLNKANFREYTNVFLLLTTGSTGSYIAGKSEVSQSLVAKHLVIFPDLKTN